MEYGLSDEELNECIEIFEFLDINHDKRIDLEELLLGENAIGLNLSEHEIEVLIHKIGKVSGSYLNFEEFVEFYKECMLTHEVSRNEVFKMFNSANLNKDGYLDLHDLKYMLITQGEIVSQDEIDSLLRDYDKNKDGKLNLDEFMDSIY
jgi:Ca2+-binding EF-hand superfamily protein